jgi:hypothetical protein
MPTKLQLTFTADAPKGDVITICLIGKDCEIIPDLDQALAAHLIDAMAAFQFTGAVWQDHAGLSQSDELSADWHGGRAARWRGGGKAWR